MSQCKKILIFIFALAVICCFVYFIINSSKNNVAKPSESKNTAALEQNDDTVLRILTGEGHTPSDFVEKFEKQILKKYGRDVKLKIEYLTGEDSFWYDAVRGKNADIVLLTHHHFKDERYSCIKNGLLLPLDLKNIPGFLNVIPELQKSEYLLSDGKIYGSPVSQGPYGLVYNSAMLTTEPKSWNALWAPEFKGKYVIGANEYLYTANITALALGYSRENLNSFDVLNNHEFKAKLRQLAVNAHSFWIGVDKPENLSGMPLATSWGDSLGPLNKQGEPWKMAEPIEGMPCWIDNYAITWALADKPFLKKVAEEYINALLSRDYQVGHIMRKMSLTPIITNINDLLTEEEKRGIHLGIPDFFDSNRILLPTYTERDRNGLKMMWDEAMKGIDIEGRK